MSESGDDPDDGERSRKRVRQACLNCRKKKVRCSGEKPVCGLCSRLAQKCVYKEPTDFSACHAPSPNHVRTSDTSSTEIMISQLETLQNKMASIETTIGSIMPLLSSITKQAMPTTPNTISRSHQVEHRPKESAGLTVNLSKHNLQVAADLYFRFCHNQPYSLFHEALLRHRLASGTAPDYLKCALLGVACRYSHLQQDPVTFDDPVSYTNAAWDCLQVPWSPNSDDKDIILVLQTIVLLVSAEHPDGRCAGAYMKLGYALRLALRGRFHLEPDPSLPLVDKEERRRTFWSLYIQDRLISLSREYIPVLRDSQCKVRLPCSELAFRSSREEHTPQLEDLNSDSVDDSVVEICSPLAQCVVIASSLSRVTEYVLLEDRASKPTPPWSPTSPYAIVSSNLMQLESYFAMNKPISDELDRRCTVNGAIDQQIAGPLIYSRLLFHLCHCLLHHPFLLKRLTQQSQKRAPARFLSTTWDTCRFHAVCLSNLNQLRSQNLVLTTSLYGYSTMIAGTIHVLSLHDRNSSTSAGAEEHYRDSIEFLRELSHFWKHAGLMLVRLKRFHHRRTTYAHLLDPQQGHVGRSPEELEVLWQTVDYAMLSVPTRPVTPNDAEGTVQENTWENSFFNFDFAGWSDAPDTDWDWQDMNGELNLFDSLIQ